MSNARRSGFLPLMLLAILLFGLSVWLKHHTKRAPLPTAPAANPPLAKPLVVPSSGHHPQAEEQKERKP